MKIKGKADYGIVGGEKEITFDIEDDATEDEINEWVWEWATERVTTTWEKVDE